MSHVDTDGGLYLLLIADTDVSDLVADRVYPGRASQSAEYPRITIQRISTPRLIDMQGPSGLAFPRTQVDLWSRSPEEIKTLAHAVRELLHGYSGPLGDEVAQLVHLVDQHESTEDADDASGEPVFRIRYDFRIAAEESRPNRL